MKWIDIKKEGLPKEDGLFIIEANSGGRWQMFFRVEDKRWYWAPNPYSVGGDGIVVKWLDESNDETVFTIDDMHKAYNAGEWAAEDGGKYIRDETFTTFLKKQYNIDL
jgi:hypothetical protein